MQALATAAARLDQLRKLWLARETERAELVERKKAITGEKMLVPSPFEESASRPLPWRLPLLGAALRGAATTYRVGPDRTSTTDEAWQNMLWGPDFDAALWQLDEDSLAFGAGLAVIEPDPDAEEPARRLRLTIYDRPCYEALAIGKSSRVAAVLIRTAGKDGATLSAQAQTVMVTAEAQARLGISPIQGLEYSTLPIGHERSRWTYIDDVAAVDYDEAGHVIERTEHKLGFCPAVVVSSDKAPRGLDGKPWGGPDTIEAIKNLCKVIEQANHASLMNRGQPYSTGNIEGEAMLSPSEILRISAGGSFGIAPGGGNVGSMLDAAKRTASLLATVLDVALSALWRDGDLGNADLAAAQLALGSLAPLRRLVMRRAEIAIHRIASKMAAAYGWPACDPAVEVHYKQQTPPATTSERLGVVEQLADRGLATKAEIAAELRPELTATEIESSLDSAKAELAETVRERAAIAGHLEELDDGRRSDPSADDTAASGTASAGDTAASGPV